MVQSICSTCGLITIGVFYNNMRALVFYILISLFWFPVNGAEDKVQLAINHWKDQNQELAFKTFLEALDEPIVVTENDPQHPLYEEALIVYLNYSISPQEKAKKIFEKFSTQDF